MKLRVTYKTEAFSNILPYLSIIDGDVFYSTYHNEQRVRIPGVTNHAFPLEWFTPEGMFSTPLIGV